MTLKKIFTGMTMFIATALSFNGFAGRLVYLPPMGPNNLNSNGIVTISNNANDKDVSFTINNNTHYFTGEVWIDGTAKCQIHGGSNHFIDSNGYAVCTIAAHSNQTVKLAVNERSCQSIMIDNIEGGQIDIKNAAVSCP